MKNNILRVASACVVAAAMLTSTLSVTPPAQAATTTGAQRASSTPVKAPARVKIPKNAVYIPRLGKSAVAINTKYGYVKRGQLTVPKNVQFVRYQYGATVTSKGGTIVLTSHVNYNGKRGLLNYAHAKMRKGDKVYVSDGKGHVAAFKMTRKYANAKSKLPKKYFTRNGPKKLVIITCGGKLIRTKRGNHYSDNIIMEFTPTKL